MEALAHLVDLLKQSFVQDGKVRALAITTAERSPVLPTVPPVADTLPGYAIPFWTAIFAPANTPADIVERIAAETRKAMQEHPLRQRSSSSLRSDLASSPAWLDRSPMLISILKDGLRLGVVALTALSNTRMEKTLGSPSMR